MLVWVRVLVGVGVCGGVAVGVCVGAGACNPRRLQTCVVHVGPDIGQALPRRHLRATFFQPQCAANEKLSANGHQWR